MIKRYKENFAQEKAWKALAQVQQVILGKERQTEEILLAFLANGHILLEDIQVCFMKILSVEGFSSRE